MATPNVPLMERAYISRTAGPSVFKFGRFLDGTNERVIPQILNMYLVPIIGWDLNG